MKEIQFTPSQIEDSIANLGGAIDRAFAPTDVENGMYVPDKLEVPRPNFELFARRVQAVAEADGRSLPTPHNGRYVVASRDAGVLTEFAGLRGIGHTRVQTKNCVENVIGPAILLPGGRQMAILTAEQHTGKISDTQHAFLDGEYAKQQAKVRAEHRKSDVTNAGEIGAALVVASTMLSPSAHQDMHGLAATAPGLRTFGTNFSAAGRQDLRVGHEVRSVRSVIVAVGRAILYTGLHDQLPAGAKPLGLDLTADELTVGITLAATESRSGRTPDLVANLSNMVGE